MTSSVKIKLQKLHSLLAELESAVVAFSGGVDSTFLLKMAADVLGKQVLAVTAESSTYPSRERLEAQKLVAAIGARHRLVVSEELDIPGFSDNPPDRCYYCKQELFSKLLNIAQEEGFAYVLDGSNADDLNDYRPGMKAAGDLGVRSPLREVGFTKEEIRIASKEAGLPTWNKPAFACLSSRFPFGSKITKENLKQVELGEALLYEQGFRQFRVRHHGEIARIEVEREQFSLLLEKAEIIVAKLKETGFKYVTMDLLGYRAGSMNETLPQE